MHLVKNGIKKALKTALLLFVLSCNPPGKKTEVTTTKEEVADTAIATEQDGVMVEEPVLTQTEEMPPALLRELDRHYQHWKLPEFSETWLADFDDPGKNITWIKGDFDKNKTEDYAIQVLLRDSISVIAFLQQPKTDTFSHFVLERGPLSRYENEPLKSFYQLRFLSAGDSVYDGHKNGYHKIPQDAIYLANGNDVKVFYKAGKWKTLEMPGPKSITD